MSESLVFLNLQKTYKKCTKKYDFKQKKLSKLLVFYEQESKRANGSKNESFTNSLIYHEGPEQIAYSNSFVMSDLSNSLTVAHLS